MKTRNYGKLAVCTRDESGYVVVEGQPDHKSSDAALRWAKTEFSDQLTDDNPEVSLAVVRVVKDFVLRREMKPTVVIDGDDD